MVLNIDNALNNRLPSLTTTPVSDIEVFVWLPRMTDGGRMGKKEVFYEIFALLLLLQGFISRLNRVLTWASAVGDSWCKSARKQLRRWRNEGLLLPPRGLKRRSQAALQPAALSASCRTHWGDTASVYVYNHAEGTGLRAAGYTLLFDVNVMLKTVFL